jgi:hypothetical protein
MLTIHITEADVATCAADDTGSPDGLAACLAQHGVAPAVIQTTLAVLPQVKTVVLCRPAEGAPWEIAVPQ